MSNGKLIVDTNLLLLLVIGAVEGGRHIKRSGRLNAYTESDFQNITEVMKGFNDIYITPYIATEVSNLIDLSGRAYEAALDIARALFRSFKKLDCDIDKDCAPSIFLRYGITDTSLTILASDFTILTNDSRLLDPLYTACPDNVLPYAFVKASRSRR
ncbi:hypothetical protein [Pseudomonas sp. PSKL.D1]|uniref:hypothetical protein n=1 Tax=Pseudomonas sp. PSKL.D1 TaxID=3029060 RepID=UPI0023810F08|nr:hypothetical protein [Pseudomonas sp. PSKL.D1]WDY56684.1 hypothetical protein PVV54_19145 [Pseudomonas sp. PSKL.D1]